MKYIPRYLTIGVVCLLTGFFLGKQDYTAKIANKSEPLISQVEIAPTQIIQNQISTEEKARQLVSLFEQYQHESKAKDVMSLFTPPENAQEAETYIELMGLDLVEPRLYSTVNLGVHLNSFSILSVSTEGDSVVVKVNEIRSTWDNSANKWVDKDPQIMVFKVVEIGIGSRVLVDKYYPENTKEGKYWGFYY